MLYLCSQLLKKKIRTYSCKNNFKKKVISNGRCVNGWRGIFGPKDGDDFHPKNAKNWDFHMKNPHQTFFWYRLVVVGRLVSCKLIWLGLLFKLLLCTVFRNHRSMLHSNCYCCMLFYWNLTEKFCQITILFPWQNKMHPSISWYIC